MRRSLLFFALTVCLWFPHEVTAAAPAPAQGRRGMVVTSQADATRAGVSLLAAGGNAVDAAVAAAFALCVTEPFASGLGGGVFLLLRSLHGEIVALDARETAPAAAHRDLYVQPGVSERASLDGVLAVATPGLVAGLLEALERYGTKSRRKVLEPAIRLAEEGFVIGAYHARVLAEETARISWAAFPETRALQFPPDGESIEIGWRLLQPELARTLRRIAQFGREGFYSGPVAEALIAEVKRAGGILSAEDLAGYQVRWRAPVRGEYRGFEVISFPPPSSGGVALIEMLHILEGIDFSARPAGSSASLHVLAEAMKLAFADRAAHLGDPGYVEVPTTALLSKPYAAQLRGRINPPRWRRPPWTWFRDEVAIRVAGPGLPPRDAGTTHLSVVDAQGNAVAITQTINTPFGSGISVPGTGVILNNEMDDFARAPNEPNSYGLVDVQGKNAIAPGKRPLSSMAPTFVMRDGELFLVTGSPGGPRIITTVLQTLVNVLDYGMDVQAAVSAPRIHHQWLPDRIVLEPEIPADVIEGLRQRGHTVEVSEKHWSAAESIGVDRKRGWYYGASDPRRDGLAQGL